MLRSIRRSVLLTIPALVLFATSALPKPHAAPPLSSHSVQAITFTSIASLATSYVSTCAWGDYDNDGDIDAIVAGHMDDIPYLTHLYRNDGGVFNDANAALQGVDFPAVAWADYDNDGDLDLALSGISRATNAPVTQLYRNSGGMFILTTTFTGVYEGSLAWADFDNDGRLDLLVTGTTGIENLTRIYRNNGGGVFTDINAGLVAVRNGAAAWADYDNDGYIDLVVTGNNSPPVAGPKIPVAQLYHNAGDGTFVGIGAGLTGVSGSSVSWGDYDNDGNLDLAIIGDSGTTTTVPSTRIYRNGGSGVFTPVAGTGLPDAYAGSIEWGDFDNDGQLDLLLSGYTGTAGVTKAYRNSAGLFSNFGSGLPNVWYSSARWGDYDNDGDLDILLVGTTTGDPAGDRAQIFASVGAFGDQPPSAPTGLTSHLAGNRLTLSWSPAVDLETPTAGLSYNLRVGTAAGSGDILSPMADGAGVRQLPALGNVGKRTSWTLTVPPAGRYFWSVQAIDGAYAGSQFAVGIVGVDNPSEIASIAFSVSGGNPSQGSTRFRLNLPTDQRVTISVLDVAGRCLATLVDRELTAGSHVVDWPDAGRRRIPSGVYMARLATGSAVLVRRFVVTR